MTTTIAGRGRRVVIVEDNHATADSMRLILTYSGYDVRVTYNGVAGIQMAEDWPPDFVLCDIGLPGLDGYSVAKALREHPATSQTHLVAVSAYGTEEVRSRGWEAGFERHFTKPVDPDEILGLLASQ